MMSWWEALVLGAVEGVTEYLPVSSTAHLILAQRALGIPASEEANAFAICVQLGAIAAVLGVFFPRVRSMARGIIGRDPDGRALAINVIVGFLPAGVLGLLFNKTIERVLFGLYPVVAAWFVGGVFILALHRSGRDRRPGRALAALTVRDAVIIGLAQSLAMWPGTSRSLATLVAGLLVGLSIEAALEYSFLLGLVTLGSATGYKLFKSGGVMLHAYGPVSLAVGFVAATVSAVLAVRWMLAWLRGHGLQVFGVYRVLLALVVAALLATGTLRP
ncbi:MAG: Undecaprenyl-diphosphatase [Myxococcaceae bacterium]|nr:Undecaprenyl-diphosphatase [Myxococcaceae bacterium]